MERIFNIIKTSNGAYCALKKRANDRFVEGKKSESIQLYTEILAKFGSENTEILLQRSLAYLNLQIYNLALRDAISILKINPYNEEAIILKVKCLWGLRQYEEAVEIVETQLPEEKLETNPEYKDSLKKSEKYFRQSKGDYDMAELLRLPANQIHEMGEYTGPIKVVPIPGKGRGVVATQTIFPGQLVLVHKAFAFVFGKETREEQDQILAQIIAEKLSQPDKEIRTAFSKGIRMSRRRILRSCFQNLEKTRKL